MTAQTPSPDLKAIKGRQQQTWASGDFAAVATTLPIVSELLCEAVDLQAGERVLDVATGSGNTAIAAPRRFCAVSGVDYVPALLSRARERAVAEGLGGAAHGTVGVLIVDAHEIMRAGLVRLLGNADGIEVVGEAAAGEAAVALAATVQPDVVLLDFILPDIDGVEVARRLLAASHPVQILMLTSISDERRVREAIEVGVIGYLLKDIGRAELVQAIVQAADGRPTLHPTVRNYLLRSVSPPPAPSSSPALSKRDRDLMRLLAQGCSNREIAGALGLTHGTVKVYVSALLDKLGVSDRTRAALIAARYGLDAPEEAALPRAIRPLTRVNCCLAPGPHPNGCDRLVCLRPSVRFAASPRGVYWIHGGKSSEPTPARANVVTEANRLRIRKSESRTDQ